MVWARLDGQRARFALACSVAVVIAASVFSWIVFSGQAHPFAREPALGGVYDAQARSLLHGRWDVPSESLSYERFRVGDRYYTYFGPWPAVLRMPVLAVTHHFDGGLSRVSMLLAFVVMLGFTSRVVWQARMRVRGPTAMGWRSLLATSCFVFVVGCGSAALFLGSRAWVYHEAILWAVAWSIASFSFVISFCLSARPRTLIWASGTAALALNSRSSVGLGPVIALGLVLVSILGERAYRRKWAPSVGASIVGLLGLRTSAARRSGWLVVTVAMIAPVAVYSYVNYVKFGRLFSVPLEKQDLLLLRPERRAVLAATDNSLFGIRYAATTLLQYLSPLAIGFRLTFPWVTFSGFPKVFGGVTFDNIEPSASITTTSTLLVVLGLFGAVAAFRPVRPVATEPAADASAETERAAQPGAEIFRIPMLAGTLACIPTVTIAVIFQRYEGDFLPPLVLGGALGLMWLGVLLGGRPRAIRVAVASLLVILGLWSCWVALALALIYQREYTPFQAPAVRAQFLEFQLDVNDLLGLPLPDVERGSRLPVIKGREYRRSDAPHGQLFVKGDCDGLYIASGRGWQTIEEVATGASGHRRPESVRLCRRLTRR